MAGLETNVGEEVLYISLKCSKGKNWYCITNYLLAPPLPCCALSPLYTALPLDIPAIYINLVYYRIQMFGSVSNGILVIYI